MSEENSERHDSIPQRYQPLEEVRPGGHGERPEPEADEAATRQAWRDWSRHAGADSVLEGEASTNDPKKAA